MPVYEYTTATGAVIAINSTGGDYAVPPTIPVVPGNGGSPLVPDYLASGNGNTDPCNGARAGIRVPNNPPTSATVAAVIWKNPDEV